MAVLVRTLVNYVRDSLQETTDDGNRWTNSHIVDYLNQAYDWLIGLSPEAFSDNSEFSCAAGTKQQLPVNTLRLIRITRNLEGAKKAVSAISMEKMNAMLPDWHSRAASNQQRYFIYDDKDPSNFYVYPPATEGSLLEMVGANLPIERHTLTDYQDGVQKVLVNERFTQGLKHYMLFLAYDRDSEDAGNAQLAQMNLQRAYNAMGIKMENDRRISPNNPANKQ